MATVGHYRMRKNSSTHIDVTFSFLVLLHCIRTITGDPTHNQYTQACALTL